MYRPPSREPALTHRLLERLAVFACALICAFPGIASAGTLQGNPADREPIALPSGVLLASTKSGTSTPAKAETVGALPASFAGELPGAGNPIRWHVDLFKDGRFQLRTTQVGQPAPNQSDDIGRWSADRNTGRITLRGG